MGEGERGGSGIGGNWEWRRPQGWRTQKRYGSSKCWRKAKGSWGSWIKDQHWRTPGLGWPEAETPKQETRRGRRWHPVGENEWGRRSGGRGKGGAPGWAGHRPLSKSEPLPREPGEKRLRDSRTHRRSRQLHRESPSWKRKPLPAWAGWGPAPLPTGSGVQIVTSHHFSLKGRVHHLVDRSEGGGKKLKTKIK